MEVVLENFRWTFLKSADYETLPDSAARFIDVLNCCSAQNLWLLDGTVTAALSLRQTLGRIGTWPNADDARRTYDSLLHISNFYKFSVTDDIWTMEANENRYYNPVEEQEFHFIFEDGTGGTASYHVPAGYFLEALAVMRLITLPVEIETVVAALSGTFSFAFFEWLISNGCVVEYALEAELSPPRAGLSFFGHAFLGASDGENNILFDPIISSNQSLDSAISTRRRLNECDAIVISHHHWDHLHFQTLCGVDRKKQFVVPKTMNPISSNPSVKEYLSRLGFSNVREVTANDTLTIGKILVEFFPFIGEPFGLDSSFDGVTYSIDLLTLRFFGSVDACHDESSTYVDALISHGLPQDIDLLFFGCTGQKHRMPVFAAGPRKISNELILRPDLIRYHPDARDAQALIDTIKPKWATPYADFDFRFSDGVQREYTFAEMCARSREKDTLSEISGEALKLIRKIRESGRLTPNALLLS